MWKGHQLTGTQASSRGESDCLTILLGTNTSRIMISALETSSTCFSRRLVKNKWARKHREALKSFLQMSTYLR